MRRFLRRCMRPVMPRGAFPTCAVGRWAKATTRGAAATCRTATAVAAACAPIAACFAAIAVKTADRDTGPARTTARPVMPRAPGAAAVTVIHMATRADMNAFARTNKHNRSMQGYAATATAAAVVSQGLAAVAAQIRATRITISILVRRWRRPLIRITRCAAREIFCWITRRRWGRIERA